MILTDLASNKYIQVFMVIVVVFALGYGSGRYVQPATEIIKTVDTTTVNQKDNKNVVTVVTEVKKPDGTDIETTTTEDKSVITTNEKKVDVMTDTVIAEKPQYRLRLGTGYNFTEKAPEYSLGFEKRFWGPVSLGAQGTVNNAGSLQSGQITLSWEF
jgi:hypothetical protein